METKSVLVDPQKSSTRLTQFLQKGTHRLVIVAPFDTKILVSPLNPSPGFGFFPDQDQSSEVWNSLLEAPESGNYSFLIQVNRYISDPLI